MNLILTRTRIDQLGVFGNLADADGNFLFHTLERSYPIAVDPSENDPTEGAFGPKIPDGAYDCVRGTHTLEPTPIHPDPQPFSTFMITGVVGHTGLLFHIANRASELKGCVAVGEDIVGSMLMNSGEAFQRLMQLQEGLDSFKIQFQTSIAL